MGNRAEKNRLRHGFPAGEKPPTPGVHTQGKGPKSRSAYRAVSSLTGWQSPKIGKPTDGGTRQWAKRHIVVEKKNATRDT